jgi:hypothetical protein
MLGEEQKIIEKNMLVEVFKNYHIGEIEVDQVEMSNARITLVDIVDKVPNTYNTNEGWVVKKMKLEYANRIVVIFPIIYQKNNVQYFNNKSTMMISKVDRGKLSIGL